METLDESWLSLSSNHPQRNYVFSLLKKFGENKEKKELVGCCFFNRFQSFFNWRTFRGTLCHDTQLGDGCVSAACKRVVAFFAFPDADAFTSDLHEAALGAPVFSF
jgi:hypothetical protein